MKRNCSSDMANVLLQRSGDVEPNPGPNTKPGNLTEHELHLLAGCIDPSDFRKVGLALGFTEAELSRFKEDNIGNIMQAIYKMLYEWLKTVRLQEAREELSNKLHEINLVQLADIVQKGQVGDHIPSLSDEEFKEVIKAVKDYSVVHHCQIPTDPLNSGGLFKFDEIFTNLTLMKEDRRTTRRVPLLYPDLLNTEVNGVLPKRLLVEGEGGVGKTILCAKIIWDWIHGNGYKDFKLVLLVLLREVKDKTIGEIIKSYLPDDIKVTAMQLNKHVFSHQKDVFLVLDGLDELAGDLNNSHQVAEIILNRLFKSGKVLITSRGWRSDEIRKITELRKLYAFIAVEGFSDENLSAYATKFFKPDRTSADDLNRFISSNDVIRENMAPFPIYIAMLCIMWKEFDGERREAMYKLQTFSQLFDEMIDFLVDHYLSKLNMPEGMDEKREEILCHLSNIGCFALQGLKQRRLVFTEEELQSWTGSVDTGCQVGVLTKQTRTFSRRERRHHSHSAVSSVQFPHKLFQEYLSGMYLASLHNSDRSKYDSLMKDIIVKASEFRELLYFTSAQKKEVGLDIISRLIASKYKRQLRYGTIDDNFIVDVAYESQDHTVAKAVTDHLSSSPSKTLEIGERMQAHTVSGHVFIMNHRKVGRLVIKKPCGRTASEDLAEIICSSSILRTLTIDMSEVQVKDVHMHDVFYAVLARNSPNSKIETLYHDNVLIERPSASRNLALFIRNMNHLKNLTLHGSYHDDFYSTSSSMASTAKIENFHHFDDLIERPSASRDFAQFICKMNYLKNLRLNVQYHDDFYSTSSSMASIAKIETLYHDKVLTERPSASRGLAQLICKMNHLKNITLYGQYHDDFYSTSSSMASTAKIEIFDLNKNLSQRPSASRDFAQFICKMNHLKNLKLYGQYHDVFYSTASSIASTAKIETLNVSNNLSERPSASRDLAQFICKMTHLKNLTLYGQYHDDFYSTLSSMASTAKIENLRQEEILSEGPFASRDLAQFICKMNHLKNVTLYGPYHDDFYSTLSSMASTAKIEILHHKEHLSERPSASGDFAQFICKMNHLKNLQLHSPYHDDFYSTSSSMASTAKIEILHHGDCLRERPSASGDFAQFICKTNHLKNLTLHGQYHDDFYSTSSSMASTAKIETLDLKENLSQHKSASSDLAHFICKMNRLKNLELDGSYHDDFYSTSSSLASITKTETLHHGDNLSVRPSASRNLAQFICKMNHLKNLTLYGQYDDDFYSTSSSMASTAKDDCNTSSTVTDLTVTNRVLEGWQDCGSMFDNVKRITIHVWGMIRCDVIHRIHLPAATEFTIQTHERGYYPASLYDDPTSLPNAIHKVSSQLVKVTFRDFKIGNDKTERVIQAFRSTPHLKHLRILRFIRCGTDERLDRSSIDSDDEHKVKVEIEHGKPVGKNFRG